MHLAQNLKCLREQRGMSQQELAEVLEISRAAVGNWETSNREPDLKTIIRLAVYFGVTLDDLVLRDLKPPVPLYVTNLRFLRIQHEMTQENMADLLGYKGKQGYNAIETGKTKPNVDDLEKLADFFGVTMDEIIKQDLAKEASR